MAELTRLGDFVGPGEENTATVLANGLPAHWKVIFGRKISDEALTDTDFIIVADNHVFLAEEKFWGPSIVLYETEWEVRKGHSVSVRSSPVPKVKDGALRLLSSIEQHNRKFLNNVNRRNHVVRGVVILSNPNLTLISYAPQNHAERLYRLDEVCQELIKYDKEHDADLGFALARDSTATYLAGLQGRSTEVTVLGNYRVTKKLPDLLDAKRFLAEDMLMGETVILRCHPMHDNAFGDPEAYHSNELRLLAKVEAIGRTWQFRSHFTYDPKDWIVIPFAPGAGSVTLKQSVKIEIVTREDGQVRLEEFLSVAEDAFLGLSQIYKANDDSRILHRLLTPERIWIRSNKKVIFSDFFGGRYGDAHSGDMTHTVRNWVRDDASDAWRPPESQAWIENSTHKSDVYSLALILLQWAVGDFTLDKDSLLERIDSRVDVVEIFADCLCDDPNQRPDAEEVAGALQVLLNAPQSLVQASSPSEIETGFALAAGRYQIRELLGVGGFARAWRAWDTNLGIEVVIKEFKDQESLVVHDEEFSRAVELMRESHPRLAMLRDRVKNPACLVYSYDEGRTLASISRIDGGLPVSDARHIAAEILQALAFLHERNFVHGDVSPSNIILKDDSHAVLIDFGLTSVLGARLTGFTIPFAAPEALKTGLASPAADLYSLAATLIFVILNRYPYEGGPHDAQRSFALSPLTESERLDYGTDDVAFLTALFECVDENIDNRPPSATDFYERLEQAWAPQPPVDNGSDLEFRTNPIVNFLREGYRESSSGATKNRGLNLDNALERSTYAATLLDTHLLPDVLAGNLNLVILTGNPGDGKTAFLVQVRDALKSAKATCLSEDKSGWTYQLRGRKFLAILDASESHQGVPSDVRISEALRSVQEGDCTALIAMNDGRMRKYFKDFELEFPDFAEDVEGVLFYGEKPTTDGFVVVDLKQRALATLSGGGLAQEVLNTFTQESLWSECNSCIAQNQCPMFMNRKALVEGADKAIVKLVLISHLRRLRRATFRDLRSAFGWIITGDKSCQNIHESVLAMRDLTRGPNALLIDLVFDSQSPDYLIREWSKLDPARQVAPGLERRWRSIGRSDYPELAKVQREMFLGMPSQFSDDVSAQSLQPFKYLSYFTETLENPSNVSGLESILLGISRVTASPTFRDGGLAIGQSDSDSGWSLLRIVPSEEFQVVAPISDGAYVEAISDTLVLKHRSGLSLRIALDMFELIMNASEGVVINNVATDALRYELSFFARQLNNVISNQAIAVSPTGFKASIAVSETKIVLEVDNGNPAS